MNEDQPVSITGLIILSQIPWPGPTVFKITCPRKSATIVRRLIQNKWIPVLDKYQVKLPVECPFHPSRDIFHPQESAKKQYRNSQWTCTLCGKSFYQEKYLDMHFDNRHRNQINMAEDAVCLSDYCDVMRCEVLQTQAEKFGTTANGNGAEFAPSESHPPITDLEVWREPSQRTALQLYPRQRPTKAAPFIANSRNSCDKSEAPQTNGNDTDESKYRCETLLDSAVPPRQKFIELQKLRSNCKPEELLKLKFRCEELIRDCIAGLLVNLSVQDFKDIEDELNNAFCWYLTCDRYWEDSSASELRHFSWTIFVVPILLLNIGLVFCYYIIWILYDSTDDMKLLEEEIKSSGGTTNRPYPYSKQYSEEFFPATDHHSPNDHYIYVTYPPEIKRKLLDR